MTRVFIQGIFDYPALMFGIVLLYNYIISCFLNDPDTTYKFDEALI